MLSSGLTGSSEIDLDAIESSWPHSGTGECEERTSLACPVETVHAILEDFFLSDQSNLIRSNPCRQMPVVIYCVQHCDASLGAYSTKTMHKLF